jgi:hypothetical protein
MSAANGSTEDIADLAKRLDFHRQYGDPLRGLPTVPASDPDSWEGRQAAKQQEARQGRLAAARAKYEAAEREIAAAAETERKRREHNAPKLAKLQRELRDLEGRRRAEYDRHLAGLDEQIRERRKRVQELS